MYGNDIYKKLAAFQASSAKIAVAESCTGGMLAALLTEMPGSSKFFQAGFVTYSNDSKINVLSIDTNLLVEYGAVSEQVAIARAINAVKIANADIAVAITGLAGPQGETSNKKIGTVCFAGFSKSKTISKTCHFEGSRAEVRLQSVEEAMSILAEL